LVAADNSAPAIAATITAYLVATDKTAGLATRKEGYDLNFHTKLAFFQADGTNYLPKKREGIGGSSYSASFAFSASSAFSVSFVFSVSSSFRFF
jgi:hypothetical protein